MMPETGRGPILAPIFLLSHLASPPTLDYLSLARWHSSAETANFAKIANIFKILGGLHEIPSASRPRRGQAYRRRREVRRRHHHSRFSQGKALAGRSHRRRPGWP